MINDALPTPVELTLPKFNITQTHDKLVDAFKSMGTVDLFNDATADLRDIDGKPDLFVKGIARKTTIEIDETGAEGVQQSSSPF